MIELTYGWRCTFCGHSRSINPLREEAPKKCPACNDGDSAAFTAGTYPDDKAGGLPAGSVTDIPEQPE